MTNYKTTAHCPVCDTKFLYAITEEELEASDVLEAMCPECGEMVELEGLVPCSEATGEDIMAAYRDSVNDRDFVPSFL